LAHDLHWFLAAVSTTFSTAAIASITFGVIVSGSMYVNADLPPLIRSSP
jgi:hypothetical protein